jgi:hypothetical protein
MERPARGDGTKAQDGQPPDRLVGQLDPVEAVLAEAMAAALGAGDLVRAEVFCRELTARREARAAVVPLDMARRRRER